MKSWNTIALIKEFRRGNIKLTLTWHTALKIHQCFYWSPQGPLYKYPTTVLPNVVKRDPFIYRKRWGKPPSFIYIEDSIYNWLHACNSLDAVCAVKDVCTPLTLCLFLASLNSREIHLSTLLKSLHWWRTNSLPVLPVQGPLWFQRVG